MHFFKLHQYMHKLSKLNHYNTNSLDLIPGLIAIRLDDGPATTVHRCHIPRCHIPQTFNMRRVIPFDPSTTMCRTYNCFILATTLPMTSQICSTGLRSGDLDINSMNLLKVQSRVCPMKSRTILHQAHTPVISKRFV